MTSQNSDLVLFYNMRQDTGQLGLINIWLYDLNISTKRRLFYESTAMTGHNNSMSPEVICPVGNIPRLYCECGTLFTFPHKSKIDKLGFDLYPVKI